MKKRIGFLHIDNVHQVYHSASIAFELSRIAPEFSVELIVSTKANLILLQKLAENFPEHNCKFVYLKRYFFQNDIIQKIRNKPFPRKSLIFKHNKKLLSEYDAFISTDFYSILLKKRFGIKKAKYIFAFHGAGDGTSGYNEHVGMYDHYLFSGNKTKDRCSELGYLNEKKWKIIGYPKFDFYPKENLNPGLFPNSRPTIIYNPHFDDALSSWPHWGEEILEYFYNSEKYNLIFAPHIMLFGKFKRSRRLKKFKNASNIIIDKGGSLEGINMTYTRLADLYLGDVSSQIYEFMYRPRPCIFLNPNKTAWTNNPSYLFWKMGPVLTSINELDSMLSSGLKSNEQYVATQKSLVSQTFDLTDTLSGTRGANAIIEFLG